MSQVQIDQDGGVLQICSGLVKYMQQDQLLHLDVVVLTNLKPSKMRGVRSEAMLLAAEKKSDTSEQEDVLVSLVKSPVGTPIGERLFFQGFSSDESAKKLKSSAWQEIQKCLKTDSVGEAFYQFEDSQPAYLENDLQNRASADLQDAIIR